MHVVARTTGFQASFEGWLQTEDLVRFSSELAEICENMGQPGTAILSSAEPEVEIVLSSNRLGILSHPSPGSSLLHFVLESAQSNVLGGAYF